MAIWHEKPAWQVSGPSGLHVAELEHDPLAQLSPAAHTLPQAPQLLGSVWRSTHAPLHSVPVHVDAWHAPAVQTSPGGHATPQAPQLFGSVCVSTQAVPQIVKPHVDDVVQVPFTHT